MSAYLIPLKTAILVFFVLANIFSVPFLFWEYHKKGALTFFKGLVIYSFIFYLMTAFFMTLLPFPSKEHVEALTSPYAQLVPFMFVFDIIRESTLNIKDISTCVSALLNPAVLQVVFNVILLIPFGVYLRYYFNKDLKTVILLTFLMSLFYEITQITGVYGIYSRPYRLFDVDDLILNTFGGFLGYYITPLIVFLFPKKSDIEEHVVDSAKTIPTLRRAFSYGLDYSIISFLINVLTFKITINKYLKNFLIAIILGFIYYIFNGSSIGLKLLNLKIVDNDNKKLKLKNLLKRTLLFVMLTSLINILSNDIFNILNNMEFDTVWPLLLYLLLTFSIEIVFLLHIIIVGALRKKLMFHEKFSNTKLISTLDAN